MKENKKESKIKVKEVIINTVCVLLFAFVAYGLVLKFTNNSIYLFGVRNDVVLTDSMSYKNEDPYIQEFLRDHDDQLPVGCLTFSEKITENTELSVYDIVIFKHHDTGLQTIHRIVRILDGSMYADGKNRYIIRADTANEQSNDGAYKQEEIIARYKWSIPFIGHIYSFFSSIFGFILCIGLMVIMLVYEYLDSNYVKKPKVEAPPEEKTETAETNNNEKE